MTMLFRLLAPWILCVLDFFLIQWQWSAPLFYPWPFAVVLASFIFAVWFIGYKRMSWAETAHKMGPVCFFLFAVSVASVLAEGIWWQWGIAFCVAGTVFLSLKLFFLFCYDPQRYPVNALSHVGLSMVPLGFFFLVRGTSGLWIFLRTPDNTVPLFLLSAIVFAGFGAYLYRWTMHPSADLRDRARWTWFGVVIGLQMAVLMALLPFGIGAHGALAALYASVPLRIRRYAYQPRPSRRIAWTEGVAAAGAMFGVLLLVRWA